MKWIEEVLGIFLLGIFLFSLSCGNDPKNNNLPSGQYQLQEKVEQLLIKYEVFRDYGLGSRKVILVSEKATKEEVLTLASYLKTNYMAESNGWVFIEIFDSKEAFLNQTNLNYPEKKYFKHFLVDAGNNPHTGVSWLDWVAEDREIIK